jgi:hypothetical protein
MLPGISDPEPPWEYFRTIVGDPETMRLSCLGYTYRLL